MPDVLALFFVADFFVAVFAERDEELFLVPPVRELLELRAPALPRFAADFVFDFAAVLARDDVDFLVAPFLLVGDFFFAEEVERDLFFAPALLDEEDLRVLCLLAIVKKV